MISNPIHLPLCHVMACHAIIALVSHIRYSRGLNFTLENQHRCIHLHLPQFPTYLKTIARSLLNCITITCAHIYGMVWFSYSYSYVYIECNISQRN